MIINVKSLLKKFSKETIIKISLLISLLTQASLIYLNNMIEGKIKYIGYIIYLFGFILTLFCDKDLYFASLKTKRKITLLKNVYIFLLIFIMIYYPLSFHKDYIKLKNSYTFILFIISLISTIIFHILLMILLYSIIPTKDKINTFNDEQIEEEIKRAMLNENSDKLYK